MPALTLLVVANPSAAHLKALERLAPESNVIVSNDRERLRSAAPEADVILNADLRNPKLLSDIFPLATRVRWVHTLSAGVENVLSPEIATSPVPMTNGRGVFRRPLAEWAIAAMLHFSYGIRRLLRSQQAQRWEPFDHGELDGRTLAIVGYGEIGRAVAELARPFGMTIVAVRRRPELSAADPLLDGAYPPARIGQMLAASDFVAVAAPLTPETRGLIGAAQIASMKPGTVIVNIGRGPVIDEAALIRALESGAIGGAALDVFETEPLPAGHPFYRLDNVLLSPHCADHTFGWIDRAVDCFLDNFERFRQGEPLRNVVDKHAGY
jgi:phosphoglycerate dehydrogenase-like enzyme